MKINLEAIAEKAERKGYGIVVRHPVGNDEWQGFFIFHESDPRVANSDIQGRVQYAGDEFGLLDKLDVYLDSLPPAS